jgi:hypothetical protein
MHGTSANVDIQTDYKNIMPFGKDWQNWDVTEGTIKNNAAYLVLYDDGWRLKKIE